MAAVSPATPPPITVICRMAGTVRRRWPRVQCQFVGHDKGPVDLLLELDRRRDLPLHEQLERALRDAVRAGRLQAAAPLPSSRRLAVDLGVSRGVVTSAYDQLAAEGYLQTKQGAPVRVARGVRTHPGRPHLRCWRDSLTTSARGCPISRAFPVIAGCARCAAPGARRRWTPSATAIRVASPSCARHWPTTLAAFAARQPTPSTCWSAPAFARGCH